MHIGICHHGRWHCGDVSNDGYSKILIPIVSKLLEAGHKVTIWNLYNFATKDPSIEAANIDLSIKAVSILQGKDLERLSKCTNYLYKEELTKTKNQTTNYVTDFEEFHNYKLPDDIDCVMATWAGNISCIHPRLAILSHYTQKGIPCIIWDGDSMACCDVLKVDPERIDIQKIKEKLIVCVPSDCLGYHRKFFNHCETLHYPYPKEELPVKKNPSTDIVYAGNDYNRREAFKRIYGGLRKHGVKIYGKWKEQMYPERIQYMGGIPPSEVSKVVNDSCCSIQIMPACYSKKGYVTLRCNEVPAYGSILIGDSKILGIEKRTKFLARNSWEAEKVVDQIKSMTFEQRCQAVEEQREIARQFSPTRVTMDLVNIIQKYREV